VEILDSCIGCQACARACQYGAIKIYKVVEGDSHYQRFLSPDKKIQPKFIADKCNHCYGYEDLVCITNCPTGAIIEVEATDLLENPRIFGAVEGFRKPLDSVIQSDWLVSLLQTVYFAVGFLVIAFLGWEAYVLQHRPSASFLLAAQQAGYISNTVNLAFGKGTHLNVFLGNMGFSMILLGLLYPLRKAFPRLFKYLGKKPLWLDFHNFCGIMGTTLITFHHGFSFPFQPSTFGYFALVTVMLSGIFGRFLYHVIPRGVAGTELKARDIEEEDAVLSQKLDALFEGSKKPREIIDKIVAAITQDAYKVPSVWKLFRAVFLTKYFLLKLRLSPPKELHTHQRQIGVFLRLLTEKVRLKRNVAFLGLSSRLFVKWLYIHKPFAYMMCMIAIGHIVYNLLLFKWNV